MNTTRIFSKAWLIIGFLFALIVRFWLLFKRPVVADEVWALFLTQASFSEIWWGTFSEVISPFYFLMIKSLNLVFGLPLSVIFLRLVACIFGILASISIGFLTNQLLGKRVAVVAFFLSLFLPAAIWASVFARYYSFLILLATWSAWAMVRFCRTKRISYLIFLVLMTIIGGYTHYYFFFYWLVFGVFLWFSKKNRPRLKAWFLASFLVSILASPALYYLLTLPKPIFWRATNNLLKIPGVILGNLVSVELLLHTYGQELFRLHFGFFLTCLLVVTMVLLGRGLKNWKNDFWALMLLIIFLPPLTAFLVSIVFRPVLGLNSLLIFLPALVIVLARGLGGSLKMKPLSVLFIFFILLSNFLFFDSSLKQAVYNQPYLLVKDEIRADDLILHDDIYTYIQAKYFSGSENNFGVTHTIYPVATENALGYQKISRENVWRHQGRIWYFEPVYFNVAEAKSFKERLDNNVKLLKRVEFKETLTNLYLYSGNGEEKN
jgi:hypothetical protein